MRLKDENKQCFELQEHMLLLVGSLLQRALYLWTNEEVRAMKKPQYLKRILILKRTVAGVFS